MRAKAGRESGETAVSHYFHNHPPPPSRKMRGLFHPLNFLFLTWVVAVEKSWVFFLILIFMEFVAL